MPKTFLTHFTCVNLRNVSEGGRDEKRWEMAERLMTDKLQKNITFYVDCPEM